MKETDNEGDCEVNISIVIDSTRESNPESGLCCLWTIPIRRVADVGLQSLVAHKLVTAGFRNCFFLHSLEM